MSATDKKREGRIKWECPFTEKKRKKEKARARQTEEVPCRDVKSQEIR